MAKLLRTVQRILFCSAMLYFSQSIQAQELRPIDLRVEIDASIYSSTLCQKIVALHDRREDAPWGLTFAKPSHLCGYPDALTKAYGLNMWRLLVSDLPQGLKFSICRPVPQGRRLGENCTWTIAIKKQRNWRETLVSDDFLFLMVAGLHEQLPFRDFNSRGEGLSRPEPRMKSERLENPPPLVRGRLNFDSSSGRMLFTPFNRTSSDRNESATPESHLWWLQKEEKSSRLKAFDELLEEEGHVLLPQPELSQSQVAQNTDSQFKGRRPQSKTAQPTSMDAEGDDVPSPNTINLENLFAPIWNGVWQTHLTLLGLPIPDFMTDRLPSMMAGLVELRHPLWSRLSTGILARYGIEKESAQLRINTSLTGQNQIALGTRSTYMLGGQLDLTFACFTHHSCQVGAASGFGEVKTNWNYDRETTTLSVWSPSGRGTFVQPWIGLEPQGLDEEGPTAQMVYLRHVFNGGRANAISFEGGWNFRPSWALADWGPIKLAAWKTLLGYRLGEINKTEATSTSETGTSTSMTSLWIGLQARLSEVVQ